jgi:hypothetical protein
MNESVTIALSADEALLLFEWLAKLDVSRTVQDAAAQRVLWAIEATLEKALVAPFAPNYDELLAAARERILRQ